jgi:hypothetical protein
MDRKTETERQKDRETEGQRNRRTGTERQKQRNLPLLKVSLKDIDKRVRQRKTYYEQDKIFQLLLICKYV